MQIAVEVGDNGGRQRSRISILDLNRSVLSPLTTEPGSQHTPHFSPDGKWVYYSAFDESEQWQGLYRRRTDRRAVELVDDGPDECRIRSISSDGEHLLVSERRATGWGITVISLGSGGESPTRTPWPADELMIKPDVSPDGRYVAYTSAISGRYEIYVRPFDSTVGGETQVSSNGGDNAMWSPDGQRLYFMQDTGNADSLMAVEFVTGAVPAGELPSIEIGEVKQLVQLDVAPSSSASWQHLQIMPDGKSLLRIGAELQNDELNSVDDPAVIHVTQNLFTELERLAPTKRQIGEKN